MYSHRTDKKISYGRYRAFTLIELLVVISIISLLLSILMPSLSKAKESAKSIVCSANLHQMYLGWTVYDTDYKKLPPGYWGSANLIRENVHKYLAKSYGVQAKAVRCPSSGKMLSGDYYAWNGTREYGLMSYNYLGGDGGGVPGSGSMHNGWYINTNWYFPAASRGFYPRRSLDEKKLCRAGRNSENPIFLDIATWDARGPDSTSKGLYKPNRSNHESAKNIYQNVAFYDGHVDKQRLVSNKSWQFGGDYYQLFFITEPAAPQNVRLAP